MGNCHRGRTPFAAALLSAAVGCGHSAPGTTSVSGPSETASQSTAGGGSKAAPSATSTGGSTADASTSAAATSAAVSSSSATPGDVLQFHTDAARDGVYA